MQKKKFLYKNAFIFKIVEAFYSEKANNFMERSYEEEEKEEEYTSQNNNSFTTD